MVFQVHFAVEAGRMPTWIDSKAEFFALRTYASYQ
jgi:hypothetical protein